MTDLVIGSGPAGVAVASALLARGRKVVLLDGGKSLEPGAETRRAALAAHDPSEWTNADRSAWQAPQHGGAPGQVRRYGSDFAMEPAEATFADTGGIALRSSLAVGGLSNLWGSAVLPYSPHDMRDWPVTPEEMAPHYTAVARLLPVPSRRDALAALFPAELPEGPVPPEPTPQAKELLARLDRQSTRLRRLGMHVGLARRAVQTGCKLCGQCLHGCPWTLIWSSRQTLAGLTGHPAMTYLPGAVATRFSEDGSGVTLTCEDGREVHGARLFIAAGVLGTARLLLASRPGSEEVVLRDSQQAFLPMLHRWRVAPRPDRLPLTTLPQLFAEIDDPAVSPRLVHAQVYTWNEHYARDLRSNYGRLPLAGPLLDVLSRRLIVAQVFLHSDHSSRIALRLAGDSRLKAEVRPAPETEAVLKRALAAVASGFRFGGLVPLGFAARPGAPGASFHVGASFPMSSDAGPKGSDLLGRPAGLERVHLVDASSLPAIPATTITLGVMAHAYRIGSLAP